MKKSFLLIAGLCLITTAAQAQIQWDSEQRTAGSPAYSTSTSTYNNSYNSGYMGNATGETTYTGNYSTGQTNRPLGNQLHQNLNFDGNATMGHNDVMKLQKALRARGYYHGKIDGLWGGQTTQAILDYQGANEQALTGTMTPATLTDLGVRVTGR